jgi:hypothetical protein
MMTVNGLSSTFGGLNASARCHKESHVYQSPQEKIVMFEFMRAVQTLFQRNTLNGDSRFAIQNPRIVETKTTTMSRIAFQSIVTKFRLPMALMLFATLIGPVAALDNDIVLQQYPGTNMIVPHPEPHLPLGLIGTYVLIVAGLLTTAKKLLGPLMGISSVLWFIMRNDAAIKPGTAWT